MAIEKEQLPDSNEEVSQTYTGLDPKPTVKVVADALHVASDAIKNINVALNGDNFNGDAMLVDVRLNDLDPHRLDSFDKSKHTGIASESTFADTGVLFFQEIFENPVKSAYPIDGKYANHNIVLKPIQAKTDKILQYLGDSVVHGLNSPTSHSNGELHIRGKQTIVVGGDDLAYGSDLDPSKRYSESYPDDYITRSRILESENLLFNRAQFDFNENRLYVNRAQFVHVTTGRKFMITGFRLPFANKQLQTLGYKYIRNYATGEIIGNGTVFSGDNPDDNMFEVVDLTALASAMTEVTPILFEYMPANQAKTFNHTIDRLVNMIIGEVNEVEENATDVDVSMFTTPQEMPLSMPHRTVATNSLYRVAVNRTTDPSYFDCENSYASVFRFMQASSETELIPVISRLKLSGLKDKIFFNHLSEGPGHEFFNSNELDFRTENGYLANNTGVSGILRTMKPTQAQQRSIASLLFIFNNGWQTIEQTLSSIFTDKDNPYYDKIHFITQSMKMISDCLKRYHTKDNADVASNATVFDGDIPELIFSFNPNEMLTWTVDGAAERTFAIDRSQDSFTGIDENTYRINLSPLCGVLYTSYDSKDNGWHPGLTKSYYILPKWLNKLVYALNQPDFLTTMFYASNRDLDNHKSTLNYMYAQHASGTRDFIDINADVKKPNLFDWILVSAMAYPLGPLDNNSNIANGYETYDAWNIYDKMLKQYSGLLEKVREEAGCLDDNYYMKTYDVISLLDTTYKDNAFDALHVSPRSVHTVDSDDINVRQELTRVNQLGLINHATVDLSSGADPNDVNTMTLDYDTSKGTLSGKKDKLYEAKGKAKKFDNVTLLVLQPRRTDMSVYFKDDIVCNTTSDDVNTMINGARTIFDLCVCMTDIAYAGNGVHLMGCQDLDHPLTVPHEPWSYLCYGSDHRPIIFKRDSVHDASQGQSYKFSSRPTADETSIDIRKIDVDKTEYQFGEDHFEYMFPCDGYLLCMINNKSKVNSGSRSNIRDNRYTGSPLDHEWCLLPVYVISFIEKITAKMYVGNIGMNDKGCAPYLSQGRNSVNILHHTPWSQAANPGMNDNVIFTRQYDITCNNMFDKYKYHSSLYGFRRPSMGADRQVNTIVDRYGYQERNSSLVKYVFPNSRASQIRSFRCFSTDQYYLSNADHPNHKEVYNLRAGQLLPVISIEPIVYPELIDDKNFRVTTSEQAAIVAQEDITVNYDRLLNRYFFKNKHIDLLPGHSCYHGINNNLRYRYTGTDEDVTDLLDIDELAARSNKPLTCYDVMQYVPMSNVEDSQVYNIGDNYRTQHKGFLSSEDDIQYRDYFTLEHMPKTYHWTLFDWLAIAGPIYEPTGFNRSNIFMFGDINKDCHPRLLKKYALGDIQHYEVPYLIPSALSASRQKMGAMKSVFFQLMYRRGKQKKEVLPDAE